MEEQPLRRMGVQAPERERNLVPVHRVKHSQEGDRFAQSVELLSHLECNRSAHAISSDEIRPMGQDSPDLPHLHRRHFRDPGQRRATPVQALRLQTIKWLVVARMPRKVAVHHHRSAGSMHAEEWRFDPPAPLWA